MKPAPLADMADEKAWRAAQQAARRAGHGQRRAAQRRLARVTHEILQREVAAQKGGR